MAVIYGFRLGINVGSPTQAPAAVDVLLPYAEIDPYATIVTAKTVISAMNAGSLIPPTEGGGTYAVPITG